MAKYTAADMVGYGHAAYCAGWKAAILAMSKPNAVGDRHGYDWLKKNLPEANGEPLWHGLPPIAQAIEAGTVEPERLDAQHESAVR